MRRYVAPNIVPPLVYCFFDILFVGISSIQGLSQAPVEEMIGNMRQFEVRQANRLLEAMLTQADGSQVTGFMANLAELAGISRVQAQGGLRVLVSSGRIEVRSRAARGKPGQFFILDTTPIRMANPDERQIDERSAVASTSGSQSSTASLSGERAYLAEARPTGSRYSGELAQREISALHRENAARRDRIAVLEQLVALGQGGWAARAT